MRHGADGQVVDAREGWDGHTSFYGHAREEGIHVVLEVAVIKAPTNFLKKEDSKERDMMEEKDFR